MKPSGGEPVDGETAAEAVRDITPEERMSSLDQEILESARRMAADPEHREDPETTGLERQGGAVMSAELELYCALRDIEVPAEKARAVVEAVVAARKPIGSQLSYLNDPKIRQRGKRSVGSQIQGDRRPGLHSGYGPHARGG